jgi:hypothetical protein
MANIQAPADQSRTTPQARFGSANVRVDENCCVYFLAGAGLIKIGVTSNLTSRLRAIRNSSPVPLELIGSLDKQGTFREMQLHGRFASLRRHGEWFEDDGSIRAYLADQAAHLQCGEGERRG